GAFQEIAFQRRLVEATDPDVDRVDFASADDAHQFVAGLLQRETLPDYLGVVLGHLERALVAEEVGRVQHVDMEGVALDPFAAVEQPAERTDLTADRDPKCILHRMDRAHLIGDRANAADAGSYVRCLSVRAAAQERLEEARRLEDTELGTLHLSVA